MEITNIIGKSYSFGGGDVGFISINPNIVHTTWGTGTFTIIDSRQITV
jgi:hypothetical protein